MTERPIFIRSTDCGELVREVYFSIQWHPGFAVSQKQENIRELHGAAATAGFSNVLEISTKSDKKRGQHLSAFHLKIGVEPYGLIPLESAFQGSKVFEGGGPYVDLYAAEARMAKRDPRLRESGRLVAFQFEGFTWPIEPKTAFYDWLYSRCIYPYRDWAVKLYEYDGFSDIEFNPFRSINCQARSIALFLSLLSCDRLDDAMKSPLAFLRVLENTRYRPDLRKQERQPALSEDLIRK